MSTTKIGTRLDQYKVNQLGGVWVRRNDLRARNDLRVRTFLFGPQETASATKGEN